MLNKRKLLSLVAVSPLAAVPSEASPQRFVPTKLQSLPSSPQARLVRLRWLFHFRVQHQWHLRENGYSYAGTGRWPLDEQATRRCDSMFEERMVLGLGRTEIEAIDNWYEKMPAGKYYAIFWHLEPTLKAHAEFDPKPDWWAVHSRFALVEHQ